MKDLQRKRFSDRHVHGAANISGEGAPRRADESIGSDGRGSAGSGEGSSTARLFAVTFVIASGPFISIISISVSQTTRSTLSQLLYYGEWMTF